MPNVAHHDQALKHSTAVSLVVSVRLIAISALVFFAGGASAQEQRISTPILSSALREATAAETPAIENLTPIESIGAGSDIRPFLAPGVPENLRCAALRRVWSTDPAIRDFIGLSENSWDFNASDGIPGFGPLITGAGRLAAEAAGSSVLNVSDKSATELSPSWR